MFLPECTEKITIRVLGANCQIHTDKIVHPRIQDQMKCTLNKSLYTRQVQKSDWIPMLMYLRDKVSDTLQMQFQNQSKVSKNTLNAVLR